MLQNPHRSQPHAPRHLQDLAAEPIDAKKLSQHSPSSGSSAKKFAQQAKKRRFWGVLSVQGEYFRACTMTLPRRANFFAHEARQHGDIETTNTTARPQQGSLETGITTAPDNCTKNTHFASTKAMAVSVEDRPARAKVMAVSGERATAHEHTRPHWCGGRRRDLPRCPWAATGAGRTPSQRTKPHASTPGPTGVKGAGGTGGHGRASRRGAERSEAA